MLKTQAHGDKLNEFYYLPKKEAKIFVMKKMDGERIIKNGIVINMFTVLYFKHWFIFDWIESEMRQTILNV